MSYPATLPHSHEPLAADPFLEYTHKGLFAAPWLERPEPLEFLSAQRLARSLARAPGSAADWTPALSHLLDVRSHCLQAAVALDPIPARNHYGDALKCCRTALDLLHHATEGPEGALATWAAGVHALIQAQLVMPDLKETERLAREATVLLSGIAEPLCAGAEQDARAAALLAREPAELQRKLETLPDQIRDKGAYYRYELEQQEHLLNLRLSEVKTAHAKAFQAAAVWGLINLVLMASLPLNGRFAPSVPWSLPFVVAVPLLWWLTWDRPFRGKLRFYDWIRWLKVDSIARLTELARELPDPCQQFCQSTITLLRAARQERELLAAYHLFILPSAADTVDEAAALAEEGKSLLAGTWHLELANARPWALVDVLQVDPRGLRNGIRIFHGSPQL